MRTVSIALVLSIVVLWMLGMRGAYAETYNYDLAGRLTGAIYTNHTQTSFAYDPAGNITSIHSGTTGNSNAPVVTIVSPSPGSIAGNPALVLYGIASGANQVLLVAYQVNNGTLQIASTTNGWTTWTASVNLPLTGTNLVTFYGFDAFGNTSTNQIAVNYAPADLVPIALQVPAVVSGPPDPSITMVLCVTNQGLGAASSAQGYWNDCVYLSLNGSLNSSQLLFSTSLYHAGSVVSGGCYWSTNTFQLPIVTNGTYYLILKVNAYNNVYESNTNNNTIVVPVTFNLSGPADLAPIAFQVPSPVTGPPNPSVTMVWGVTNQGAGTANNGRGYWYDYVYFSTNGLLDGRQTYVGAVSQYGPVASGSSYWRTNTFQIPVVTSGTYYLIFKANAYNDIYESNTNNNVAVVPVTFNLSPPADLMPVSFQVPTVVTGLPNPSVTMIWGVTNQGAGPATNGLGYWFDYVYLSTNGVLDGSQTYVGSVSQSGPIPPGGIYWRTNAFQVPVVTNGAYYLIFKANANNAVYESNTSNNVAVVPVTFNLSPPADLAPIAFQAPAIVTGPPNPSVTMVWGVTNQGAGTAMNSAGYWYDYVYLSTNGLLDGNQIYVGSLSQSGPIASGGSYWRTNTFQVPVMTSGSYFLIFKANAYNYLYESNFSNNVAVIPVTFNLSLPSDLAAIAFQVPTVVTGSQSVTAIWGVTNQGAGPAANGLGYWYDAIYLSTNGLWDGSQTFLNSFYQAGPLQPGSAYWRTNSVVVPVTKSGTYYLMLKVDNYNYVYELNKSNNVLSAQVTFNLPPPPPNDAFSNSIPIIGYVATVTGNNILATKEPGEPNHAGKTGGKSVWWTWTGPANSSVTIDTIGSSFDTLLGVYTGTNVSALTLVAGDDDSGGNLTSKVTFQALQGVAYQIAVDGYGGASGNIVLNVHESGGPSGSLQVTLSPLGAIAAGAMWQVDGGALQGSGTTVSNLDIGNHTVTFLAVGGWLSPTNQTVMITTGQTNTITATYTLAPLPDLAPTAFQVPTVVNGPPYPTVTLAWNVANQGGGATFGYWYDGVYLSTNGVLDSNSVACDYVFESATLQPGQNYWQTNTIQVPVTQSGAYYLIFQANPFNTMAEANTNNNVMAVPVTFNLTPPPDLAPLALIAPSIVNVVTNASVTVIWGVTNQGAGVAQGSWYDDLYLSTSSNLQQYSTWVMGQNETNPVAPGAVYWRTNTVQLPISGAGQYYLIFSANDYQTVYEVDLTNNTAVVPIAVVATNDLALFVTSEPNPVAVSSPLVYTIQAINGGPASATGVRLTNTLPAGVILVSASTSQGSITTNGSNLVCAMGTLTNGASATATITVTPTAMGVYLTNVSTISRNEIDADLSDNTVTNVTRVRGIAPPNDNFANRFTIVGLTDTVTGSDLDATTEPSEPFRSYDSSGATVWWTWTAPANGWVTIDTTGSSFETLLAIFTGDAITNLVMIAEDDGFGGSYPSQASFFATADTIYQIEVDGIFGSTGSILMNLTQVPSGVPAFIVKPLSQTISAGANAGFSADAVGDIPIMYQWQFNGTNLPNANGTSLGLTNLQFSNAGLYSVMASNSSGTASVSALLTVGASLNASVSSGRLLLTWPSPYLLQTSTNVAGPYQDIIGAFSPFTNLIGSEPKRFFRLRSSSTNRLSADGFSSYGQFTLNGSGVLGYNYVVQASTNLTHWISIQTNTVPFVFVDTNASYYPSRFYRMLLLQ